MGTNLADEQAAAWTVASLSDSQYLVRQTSWESLQTWPWVAPLVQRVREQQASGLVVGKGGLSWLSVRALGGSEAFKK